MRSTLIVILLLLLFAFSNAQESRLDRLKLELKNATNDTLRMALYAEFAGYYYHRNVDSGLYFNQLSLLLAQKLKLKIWEAWSLGSIADLLMSRKNYPGSYKSVLQGLKIAGDPESEQSFWYWRFMPKGETARRNRLGALVYLHQQLDNLYALTGDTSRRISENLKSIKIAEELNDSTLLSYANNNLGQIYLDLNKIDSSLISYQKALNFSLFNGFQNKRTNIMMGIGDVYYKKANAVVAKQYYLDALNLSIKTKNQISAAQAYGKLASLFRDEGQKDSSLHYATKSRELFESLNSLVGKEIAYSILASVYKLRGNPDSAFKYQTQAMAAKDSLNETENLKKYLYINFEEQLYLQELEKDKIQFRNKVRTFVMLAGIGVLLLLSIIFYRNILYKQKAKATIEKAYNELKESQHQLIQREKMASLGELTAGIAHEIQNPLNFVNNFSEVNKELVDELQQELKAAKIDNAISISNDIKDNEVKINHHGKRADAIVKGMLQHSRASSGKKEPTDINALADEYLRLSYHGLRAKDKSFNATVKTDFDDSLEKINIIPQDIGRVILNLLTNAFYAVNEKKKQQPEGYEPTVSIRTKKVTGKVEIRVADNGNGIPQKVLDKIFQPFFTTKPTGQGTGLGLSLAYDIIKTHGGELKVETKEGEGAGFIITLPIKNN